MAATKLVEMMIGMTGTVLPYALSEAPAGWMICDGSALPAGTANHLRAALIAEGNPYGESGGDPLLPDLRGEFVRGLDKGRGADPGRELGSAQEGSRVKGQWYGSGGSGTGGSWWSDTDAFADVDDGGSITAGNPWGKLAPESTSVTSISAATGRTRPRNVAMNYIIKT